MYHPIFQNCDWLPGLIEENVTTLDNYLYPHPLNFSSVCAKKVADLPYVYIHSSVCISLILYREALTLQICRASHGGMNRFYLYIKAVWQFRTTRSLPSSLISFLHAPWSGECILISRPLDLVNPLLNSFRPVILLAHSFIH